MWIILGRLLNRPFTKVLAGLWDLTEDVEVSRNSNSRIPSILIGPKVEEMILLECGKGPCHKKELRYFSDYNRKILEDFVQGNYMT